MTRRQRPARALILLPDLVLLAGLTLITAKARALMLPYLTVSPDSVDPMLRAAQMLHGSSWLPVSHGPQFGPALYWLHLPYVVFADSLRGCFARMAVGQAISVGVVYLALRFGLVRGASGRDVGAIWAIRIGAVVAATAIACAHGPRLALAHTYELYQAPLLAAAAGAAALLALKGHRRTWFAVSLTLVPIAVMVHPMAICLVPGSVWLAAILARRHGARSLVPALVVAGVAALPGWFQMFRVLRSSSNGFGGLGAVASSASGDSPPGIGAIVTTFVRPELPPLGILLVLAPAVTLGVAVVAHRRSRDRADRALAGFAAWAVLTQASLLGAALAIGYLQPYHLRLLLPVSALCLGALVARATLPVTRRFASPPVDPSPFARPLLALGTTVALVVASGLAVRLSVQPWLEREPLSDVLRHQKIGESISKHADDEAHWVEILSLGGPRSAWGYGPGAVMDAILGGPRPGQFSADGALYLVVHGPEPELGRAIEVAGRFSVQPVEPAWGFLPGLQILRAEDPAAVQGYTAALCASQPGVRARADAWKILDTETEPRTSPEAWFDPCVFGE